MSGLPSEGKTMNPVVLNYIILMVRNLRRNPWRTVLIMLSTSLSLFVFTALMSLVQRADGLVNQTAASVRIAVHNLKPSPKC
jgi:cell division protein FtsX